MAEKYARNSVYQFFAVKNGFRIFFDALFSVLYKCIDAVRMIALVAKYRPDAAGRFPVPDYFAIVSRSERIPVGRKIKTFKNIAFTLTIVSNKIDLLVQEVYCSIFNISEVGK